MFERIRLEDCSLGSTTFPLKLSLLAVALAVFAGFAAAPGAARAQTFVCPGGPSAGEVQIDVGRGPGVGGAPICAVDPNAPQGGGQTAEQLAASYAPARDPMAERLEAQVAFEKERAMGQVQAYQQELQAARRRLYVTGAWEFFQDSPTARPGELCAGLFTKNGAAVSVTGPGLDGPNAYLTFWGPNVPTPREAQQVRATLAQSGGDPPQTVMAFNYVNPRSGVGGILIAVPNASALLDNMLDTHSFSLSLNGRQVHVIEWSGGHAARDQLRTCMARR